MAKKSSHQSKNSDAKEGGMKDCCGICGRILLLVSGIIAVVFSLLVVASCDFIEFAATNSTLPNAPVIEFSFGQFRYDVNNTGCRSMGEDDINVDWPIYVGRASTGVALICAGVACVLIVVEFCCCRFKFSRCLLSTLFSFAVLGMALAFLAFASDTCTSENSAGRKYPCKAGQASWYAVAAIALYLLTSIISCFAPRPKPMLRRLGDDENEPCCCGGGKKKDDDKDKKEDEEKKSKQTDEEQPEPVTPQEPPPPPPASQTADVAPVVAAAAVPVATQTAPMSSVVIHDSQDDLSQGSSIIYPSNVSAVTMPTYNFVSLYDGDMYFDTDANSV